MTGGFGLNITNNVAAQFCAEQGLSSLLILPEVKDSDIASIAPTRNGKPVPTGVMIYGHMPLMLTRACPLQNIHDCAHCDKTGVLTDRKAKKFPVRCGLGVRTIYNPVPIYMGDKPGALAVDYGVAYFTLESREEAAQIWTASAPMPPLRAILPAVCILRVQTDKTPDVPAQSFACEKKNETRYTMEPITVKYKVLDARAKVPAYATPGAAAADLCAVLDAPLTVAPMQRVLVPTGLAIELPGAHSVALVYARSGLSIKHGLCMANGVGVVDSDYRGELKVPMVNLGAEAYTIQPGERVAQLCIAPVYTAAFVPAEELGDTQRGAGGFGSTGK